MSFELPRNLLLDEPVANLPAYGITVDHGRMVEEMILQLVVSFGETSGPTVGLQGSFDGVNFYNLVLDVSFSLKGAKGTTQTLMARSYTPMRFTRAYIAGDGGATAATTVTVYASAKE